MAPPRRHLLHYLLVSVSVFGFAFAAAAPGDQAAGAPDFATFQSPPAEFRGRAMWGYNLSNVTEDRITSQIRKMAADTDDNGQRPQPKCQRMIKCKTAFKFHWGSRD